MAERRALVLAGGGIVGGLYEVGALIALDSIWEGFGACDFDIYVGTSAGALIAALLANRMSPERLRDALHADRRTLPRLAGARFLSPAWGSYLGMIPRMAGHLPRVARELLLNWREALVLDTLGSFLQHLPAGLFRLDGLEAYVRGVLTHGGRTNDFRRLRRTLLIPATVLDSGAIRVFGGGRRERTPISLAVAASAAVPLLFEPVRIDGVDHVDAAITKTAHAGLAVDRGARLVILVNPLRPLVLEGARSCISDRGPLAISGQAFRIALQRRLHEGLRRHGRESPDTDFVLLEPYERDLQLFDYPLMTRSLRHEIIRRGYRTTVKTMLADYDRFAALFARHGIRTVSRRAIERRARRWSSVQRAVA